jgi:hypothetical protein
VPNHQIPPVESSAVEFRLVEPDTVQSTYTQKHGIWLGEYETVCGDPDTGSMGRGTGRYLGAKKQASTTGATLAPFSLGLRPTRDEIPARGRATVASVQHPAEPAAELSRSTSELRGAHTPKPREAAPASELPDEFELLRGPSPGRTRPADSLASIRGTWLARLTEARRTEPRIRVGAERHKIRDKLSSRLVREIAGSRNELGKGSKVLLRHEGTPFVSGPQPYQRCGAIYVSRASSLFAVRIVKSNSGTA